MTRDLVEAQAPWGHERHCDPGFCRQRFTASQQRTMTPQRGTVTARRQRLEGRARSLLSFGRFAIFGEGVTDSPQRFRLPAGTQTLRAGPQGRMVAW